MKLKEAYDLCDIWKIRKIKTKQFTFTQQLSSSFTQSKLD